MAYVGLDTGTAANAGDGSTLRAGANIVNANFEEIYNYFGNGSVLSFSGGNWIEVATGINTLSNIGIGTTNPSDPLTVYGAANISGIITASSFSGIGSFSNVVVSGASTVNGDFLVGAAATIYASTGIISATRYYGDGSSLQSVPSGLGTALSDDSGSALSKMYYVDKVLGVGATITIDPPDSSQIAFTNYPTIEVDGTYDLIVADGDDFIPDILGIGTTGMGALSGSGGRVRADNYVGRAGDAPIFPAGVSITGVTTVGVVTGGTSVGASKFYGDLIGDVTGGLTGTASTATSAGTAYAITGKPDVTLDLVTADDIQVGGAVTISGNLTVQGTQTIINTSTLDIEDKTVGIASTTAATDQTADGAGIEIFASSTVVDNNKTLTWQNGTNCWVRGNSSDKFKGVFETVSSATTYTDSSGNVVLEVDVETGTVFTYDMPAVWSSGRGANIGIVSFKNFPAFGITGGTVTILTKQTAAHGGGTGYANTTGGVGFGATITIIPKSSGANVIGIQTAGIMGGTGLVAQPAGLTTVTLSPAKDALDFISFFIHYNGGTNTNLNSYKVYVAKTGGFGFGSVGI